MNALKNLLKNKKALAVLRVLLVALLAQPAVAVLIKSSAERYPIVAVIVAAVEGLVGVAAVSVTSEPATTPAKAPAPGGDGV